MAGANATLTGFKELDAALSKLPEELAKIAEQSALREAMKTVLVKSKMLALLSKDTGLLSESIGLNVRKVKRRKVGDNRYTARVGPRTGFRRQVTRIKKFKKEDGSFKLRYVKEISDPSKYGHLIELGTSHSAAKPYIRPAIETSENEIFNGLVRGYEKGLSKAVTKLRKK